MPGRCFLRFSLSYRDVEELLAERGLLVDHVTIPNGLSGACALADVANSRLLFPEQRKTICFQRSWLLFLCS